MSSGAGSRGPSGPEVYILWSFEDGRFYVYLSIAGALAEFIPSFNNEGDANALGAQVVQRLGARRAGEPGDIRGNTGARPVAVYSNEEAR